MTADELRAEALDHVKRATEHSWGCSLNSMHGLVPVGTPCSCGLNEALAVLAASPTAPGLDVERLIDLFIGYAVNAVDGVDPGPWQRTRRVLGHVRTELRDPLFKARLQDAARLSEVQSDDH